MKEVLALIVAAVLLFFTHREGQKSGKKKAKLANLDEKEELLNEVADAELEATQSKPILDRLSGLRDRISRRRSGDGS